MLKKISNNWKILLINDVFFNEHFEELTFSKYYSVFQKNCKLCVQKL